MVTNYMMSLMKRAILAVALMLALGTGVASFAVAQESEIAPEHLAIARKYVDLTDQVGIYEITLVETAVNTARTLLRTNPDILDPVDDAISKALETYKGRKGELMDQFARMYALTFTLEELQQIVGFYETPVGQKLANANATLNQNMQDIMNVFEANLGQEFLAMVRANLKEAGYNV